MYNVNYLYNRTPSQEKIQLYKFMSNKQPKMQGTFSNVVYIIVNDESMEYTKRTSRNIYIKIE